MKAVIAVVLSSRVVQRALDECDVLEEGTIISELPKFVVKMRPQLLAQTIMPLQNALPLQLLFENSFPIFSTLPLHFMICLPKWRSKLKEGGRSPDSSSFRCDEL
jgi:hypothetical protein